MANSGHEYLLRRASLREAAKASATGMTPSNDEAVVEATSARAAADADAIRHNAALKFDERRFVSHLLNTYDQLAAWGKQNDLATLIAGATLPVQGIAAAKQIDSMNRQEQGFKDVAALLRKPVGLAEAANAEGRALWNNNRPLTSAEENAALLPRNEIGRVVDDYANQLKRRPVVR